LILKVVILFKSFLDNHCMYTNLSGDSIHEFMSILSLFNLQASSSSLICLCSLPNSLLSSTEFILTSLHTIQSLFLLPYTQYRLLPNTQWKGYSYFPTHNTKFILTSLHTIQSLFLLPYTQYRVYYYFSTHNTDYFPTHNKKVILTSLHLPLHNTEFILTSLHTIQSLFLIPYTQ